MENGTFRYMGIAHICLAAGHSGIMAFRSSRALYKVIRVARTAIMIITVFRLNCVRLAPRNHFFRTSAVLVNTKSAATESTNNPLTHHMSLTLVLCGPIRFPW